MYQIIIYIFIPGVACDNIKFKNIKFIIIFYLFVMFFK